MHCTCKPLVLFALVTSLSTSPCPGQVIRDPLIGSVIDPDGHPVAGARVAAWRAEGRGTKLLDRDYADDFHELKGMTTDERGRFALQLPAGLPCRIVVDHTPFAVWLREDCLPGDDLTIQLEQPAIFAGQLMLPGAQPTTGTVRAWYRETGDEVFRGRTDAEGRFRFDGVRPGPIEVEIVPDRAPRPPLFPVELAPGREFVHNVRLEPGASLAGRVVDAATGVAIAGAHVIAGWQRQRLAQSDQNGRFELLGGPRHDLQVHANGYVAQVLAVAAPPGPGRELAVALQRGDGAVGRILDRDGTPLAGVYVQAFGCTAGETVPVFDCQQQRTDRNGGFALTGLRPDIEHVLIVRRDGYAMLVFTLPAAGADGNRRVGDGDIVLPRAQLVRGVLVDDDGRPMPNTAVHLLGYNADRDRCSGQRAPRMLSLIDHFVGRRSCRTDHLGRFAFGDVALGPCQLSALDAGGVERARSERFEVVPSMDSKPIELVADR